MYLNENNLRNKQARHTHPPLSQCLKHLCSLRDRLRDILFSLPTTSISTTGNASSSHVSPARLCCAMISRGDRTIFQDFLTLFVTSASTAHSPLSRAYSTNLDHYNVIRGDRIFESRAQGTPGMCGASSNDGKRQGRCQGEQRPAAISQYPLMAFGRLGP
jgi:hypothetical protein